MPTKLQERESVMVPNSVQLCRMALVTTIKSLMMASRLLVVFENYCGKYTCISTTSGAEQRSHQVEKLVSKPLQIRITNTATNLGLNMLSSI